MKMRKKHIFIIVILFLILLALIFTYVKVSVAPKNEDQPENNTQEQNARQPEQKILLLVDFGEGAIKEMPVNLREGMTALDVLKIGLENLGISLKTKDSSGIVYVETIGEAEGGQNGKYWLYSINGEQAPTSADQMEIKAGDRVEWKFEKPSF